MSLASLRGRDNEGTVRMIREEQKGIEEEMVVVKMLGGPL